MPLIERYILKRCIHAFLLTFGALVGTLWVTQVLRELDVVTAKGQAIWVFLVMTVLALPSLAQLVAPIAFLAAVIVVLNSLTSDSELPVICGAGASRKVVNRPVLLLAAAVAIAVAVLQHIVAPASLSTLRSLLTRVRADVIATLVQDGGFREVDDGLTMHIREHAPDGSFHGIFINDDRDPNQSMQYAAAEGLVLERAGGTFLILQRGELIRDDRLGGKTSVVAFATYALDLSQIGAPGAAAVYRAKERSTFYLMEPEPGDQFSRDFPRRVLVEIHDRATGPLYALAFGLVALAFLGRPRTSRQDQTFAVAATVLACLVLRACGFAAAAAARASDLAVAGMYLAPIAGMAFGLLASMRDLRLRMPRWIEALFDRATDTWTRMSRFLRPRAGVAERQAS